MSDPAPGTAAPAASEERLSLGARIAYGAPQLAGAAMAIPIAVNLSIFYSDVVLVPLGLIAAVKAVARALDALTDPLMGWLTDRTRSRWGRRRPWIALGAPLAALAFVALFAPPAALGPGGAGLWLALTYTLYYLFHTVYQIPHYGLGPELTQDARQRASLYGWAEGFSVGGTLVAAALPALLSRWLGDSRVAFLLFAILFGVILTGLYWNLVARVWERPEYQQPAPNPLVPGVRRVMRNRVFRMLLTIYLIGSVTGAIPGTMMPFFTKYVLKPDDPDLWLGIFLAIYFGSAFVFMPLWVWLVKRFGKKPVWIGSFASSVVGLIALFFWVGEGDLWPMAAVLVWTGSTFSARLLLGPAIQADVIDYDELHTGKRREAQYGGLWSVLTKFTVIPSMSVPLAVLATLGYAPNIAQSETVQLAIRAIFALAPAATALLALPLAILYPINERVHARIVEGIHRHRRGESCVDPLNGEILLPPVERRGGAESEQEGWFLDHFSAAELRRSARGGRIAPGVLASAVGSLVAFVGASWLSLLLVGDGSHEPGLSALVAILGAGLSLTLFAFHALRLRAAWRLDASPLAPDALDAHLDFIGEPREGRARPRWQSPALLFVVLGGLLFALQPLWRSPARPEPIRLGPEVRERLRQTWIEQTGRLPSREELEAALREETDREILFREAVELGFLEDDPVVRERLLRNQRFLERDGDDEARFREALALGLHETDLVVRRRLVQRMRDWLGAPGREAPVSEADLLARYEQDPARWMDPPQLRLSHVYLSRERAEEVASLDARVRRADPEEAPALGDPFLLGARLGPAPITDLAGRFGGALATVLGELPVTAWSGPHESSYGLHWVWVHERRDERLRPVDEVRPELERRIREERGDAAAREALAQLRERYRAELPAPESG